MLAALPNVGLASLAGSRVVFPHATPDYFAEFAAQARRLGAGIAFPSRRKAADEQHPDTLKLGFAVEYSLSYLQSFVKDVGLPESHLPLALLTFNVGVEIGQLSMVLLALAVVRLPVPLRWREAARRPAIYGIGVVAAYWSWQRIAAIAL